MNSFQDLRQTKEWGDYLHRIGWQIVELPTSNTSFLSIRKIPWLPIAVGKLQRPEGRINWRNIWAKCKKNKVMVLYYESFDFAQDKPFDFTQDKPALQELGFRKCRDSYLPKKTIWVDLRKSEKQLLKAMKAKTRYNIGLAKRKDLSIKIVDGGSLMVDNNTKNKLFELLKNNAQRLRIFAMPRTWWEAQVKAFGDKCFAVLAYQPRRLNEKTSEVKDFDNLVAGNFFMVSRNACFYAHNGSTDLGRKLMAPSLCAWEGMLEAKRRGIEIFDFDGIDDGRLPAWRGFTKFKQGFGGKEITFAPMQQRWLWPW